MGNTSLRIEGRNMKPLIGQAATLLSQLLKNKRKQSWMSPSVIPCSTPISELPADEDIREQVGKFINPPKAEDQPESVGEGEEEERAR